MSGWISLDRSIMSHWLWQNEKFSKGQAWVDLLLWAAHTPNKQLLKGTLVHVGRGEQIRSQLTLAKAWNWDRKTVSRFLKLLEKDGMIATRVDHLTSYITICNYDSFQGAVKSSGQQKGQQKGQQAPSRRDTNNNDNNEKNDNNINDAFNFFWLNMKMKRAAKQNAERSFNKLVAKESDPMVFAKMLAEDTAQRFNLNQFGFDKLNPTTYLNQKRWEDDKPENLSEEYKYVLDAYNEATEKTLMPSAEIVTDKMIFMVKDLYAKTTLTPETIGNYFKYIATKPEFDWIRGEKENSSPMDLTYILSMEIYAKAKGKRK